MVRFVTVLIGLLVMAGAAGQGVAQPTLSRELAIGIAVDVQTLDPRIMFSVVGGNVLSHAYENLLTTDGAGRLQPQLAERWEVRDPQTIRFHLRRGVKFHTGEPFTAEAVKYSIEWRLAAENRSPHRSSLAAVDRVEIIDPYTVDVKLTSSAAGSVLRNLAYYYASIVAPGFYRSLSGPLTRSAGTGPYTIAEYRPGDRVVLERFPQYWGTVSGMPRIVFRIIPEGGTRVASLERGEIDIAHTFPIDQIERFRGNPNITILSKPSTRILFAGFRVDRKPLDDARVRQALAAAINRPEINNQLLGGRGRVINTVVVPEVFGYARTATVPAYDPARAQQWLNEAGVRGGFRVRFGISVDRSENPQVGQVISAYWETLGVRTEIDVPEFGAFGREILKRDSKYDAYLQTWATNPLHADFTLTALFHERFSDRNQYKNSEVSQLIDRARGAVDEKEAQALYQRAQELLMRDLPWVPIAVVPNVVGMNKRVQNLQLRAQEAIFFWNVSKR